VTALHNDSQTSETAWAYLVVSSEMQAQTLPDQKAWAKHVAVANGWAITRTFDSVSSGNGGVRGLFQSLIRELQVMPKAKRPARILMTRLDRLGRGDGLDAMAVLAEIRKLGVTIHTRQEGDVSLSRTADTLSPMMRLVSGAFENEARSDKARAVFAKKRAAGLVAGNRAPYGLEIRDGKFTVLKPYSKVIREAFALRQKGVGYYLIGKHLTKSALPQTFKNGSEKIVHWTPNRVLRLLANQAYLKAGMIDESTWKRVNAVNLSSAREVRPSKHPWPMSGSIFCECGKSLVGHASLQRRLRYYKCTATWNHDGHTITHPAGPIEDSFTGLLDRLTATPTLIQKHVGSAAATSMNEKKSLEKEAARLRSEISTLDGKRDAVFDLHSRGKVHDDDVAPRMAALRTSRNEVADSLRAVENRLNAFEEDALRVSDIAAVISSAKRLWKRAGNAGDVASQQNLSRAVSRKLGGFMVTLDHRFAVGAPPLVDRHRKAKVSERSD
jgi:DNA invertase Pin-like site-specific DNA recombinase